MPTDTTETPSVVTHTSYIAIWFHLTVLYFKRLCTITVAAFSHHSSCTVCRSSAIPLRYHGITCGHTLRGHIPHLQTSHPTSPAPSTSTLYIYTRRFNIVRSFFISQFANTLEPLDLTHNVQGVISETNNLPIMLCFLQTSLSPR